MRLARLRVEQDDGGCGPGPEGQGAVGQDAAEVLYPLVDRASAPSGP